MNHSPRVRTEAPNHDDMKIPTKKMKVMEVTNPRPVPVVQINLIRRHMIMSLTVTNGVKR